MKKLIAIVSLSIACLIPSVASADDKPDNGTPSIVIGSVMLGVGAASGVLGGVEIGMVARNPSIGYGIPASTLIASGCSVAFGGALLAVGLNQRSKFARLMNHVDMAPGGGGLHVEF